MISKEMVPIMMNKINKIVNDELEVVFNDIDKLKEELKNEKDRNLELNNMVSTLKEKNTELGEKLKNKSNSSIWESAQIQLHEKDKQIEQIKKELEFYKRHYDMKNPEIVLEDKSQVTKTTKNNTILKNEEVNEIIKENVQDEISETKEEKPKKKKKSKSKKKVETEEIDNLDDLERELMN